VKLITATLAPECSRHKFKHSFIMWKRVAEGYNPFVDLPTRVQFQNITHETPLAYIIGFFCKK
jgi:hypothetical protein